MDLLRGRSSQILTNGRRTSRVLLTFLMQIILPARMSSSETNNKNHDFHFSTPIILPINPISFLPDSWENVQRLYTNHVSVSKSFDAKGSWNDHTLSLSWTTDIGLFGNCVLPRSKADQPSELVPLEKEWESFKTHVNGLEGRRYLFRGQNKPWRMRTEVYPSVKTKNGLF